MAILPKYPIYVPSKGRHERCLTANFLLEDGVPFYLVVEPEEAEDYARRYPQLGEDRLLVLPWHNIGVEQLVKVRNWIKDLSTANGDERHWQLDDNIHFMLRRWKGRRFRCPAGPGLRMVEDFADRYENVALAGHNYYMFVPNTNKAKPLVINAHVYSCTLINNAIPYRYRGPRNEDVDMCLQVLTGGWCTVLFNAVVAWKNPTMKMGGGNAHIYTDDGRLKMSRVLERRWPGVVRVTRKFSRPHHQVAYNWKRFDNQLILRPGVNLEELEPNEYGMKMEMIREPKNPVLTELYEEAQEWYEEHGP